MAASFQTNRINRGASFADNEVYPLIEREGSLPARPDPFKHSGIFNPILNTKGIYIGRFR